MQFFIKYFSKYLIVLNKPKVKFREKFLFIFNISLFKSFIYLKRINCTDNLNIIAVSEMSDKRTSSAKSNSRRRRWEVKSKESFESSLAISSEANTPNKEFKNKIKHTTNKSLNPFDEDQDENIYKINENPNSLNPFYENENTSNSSDLSESITVKTTSQDALSAKLSTILDNTSKTSKKLKNETDDYKSFNAHHEKEQNQTQREVKMYDNEETSEDPTAPPLSPEVTLKKKETKSNKSKKKKIKSSHNEESFITSQLKYLQEDVINYENNNNESPAIIAVPGLLIGQTNTPMNNIGNVYCEKMNGFVIAKNKNVLNGQENEKLHDMKKKSNRVSHATSIQTGFRTFSVLCQGLLAGISLAHCLLVSKIDYY